MKRTIMAFLVAPLFPALVPAWFLYAHNPGRTFVSGWIVLCIVLYFLQGLIGIPVYLLAKTKRYHVSFFPILGSVVLIILYIAASVFSPRINSSIAEFTLQIFYFAILGFSVGWIFRLVARPNSTAAFRAETSK